MTEYRITTGIGFTADGVPIPADKVEASTRAAMRILSRAFGGCTVTDHRGAWYDAARGELVEEVSRTFAVVTDAPDAGPRMSIHASDVRALFEQAAVLYTAAPVDARFVEGAGR